MKRSTLKDYKQRMLRVLLYIQQHLDEQTPLEDLARTAAFSPYHFHRIFRGMLGESVKEHIRRLRLERAAMRLKHSDMPITRVAFEAGYESHEAFTRAFKAMRGVTPSEFRSRNGTYPQLKSLSQVHFREGGAIDDFEPMTPGGEPMEVKIERLGPMRVAFIRHIGPYDQCGGAWEKLCAHLGKKGLLGPDTAYIGLCHDDPDVTPANKVRYDACCTVSDDFAPQGEVGVTVIDGGDYARTTHFGPFDKLNETYARLMGEWLPRSGRECRSAPCLEFYLTDPENTDPEDYITDIYAPLEPE
ncbi:MAG: AraC family transcriptional regulator [Gemmatimonadota bacterium]|nr:MAG: AraC family transcriptional regulator [Gemmatimonadota bacterium]